MFYAKSNPEESIIAHTNKLLYRLEELRIIYGDSIKYDHDFNREQFWELLSLACKYHDIGKVYTPFQNKILKKNGKPLISTAFDKYDIGHEKLSPLFVPYDNLNLNELQIRILLQSIYYHHKRSYLNVDKDLIKRIISDDIIPNLATIKKEIDFEINNILDNFYLSFVDVRKRITEYQKGYIDYVLTKGLLHRLDYSASGDVEIEDNPKDDLSQLTIKHIETKGKINDIQDFCLENKNKNILMIGSTGIGKTEAALLWIDNSKSFFTLPVRVSINAIYDRINELIGYKSVRLLHSSSLEYLINKEEDFNNSYNMCEQAKNLSAKITTCTIDQIFTFVFKYDNYERIYATLAYSKVVIDEIQAYSPITVAVILKGLQMINNIGGKFMIMTATLPRIYKDELEKMGIEFEYNKFLSENKRHKIKLCDMSIEDDLGYIVDKSKNSKVLVIVNTVNKAIKLYLFLQKENIKNINLLHSRFTGKDKSKLETKIKNYSVNGIWITTQIVEASLDIDFDYLYTENATLDSLFQRFGRCYRKREYIEVNEPNIYIYTNDVSGIKSVYDEVIVEKSLELLKNFNNCFILENDKVRLVDVLYSKDSLCDTKFLKDFRNAMRVLNNIVDYEIEKHDAQEILRNIDTIKVIPKSIFDENIDLFHQFKMTNELADKIKLRSNINELIISISFKQSQIYKDYITALPILNLDEIKLINLKYDEKVGLILEKDNEYDLNSRML